MIVNGLDLGKLVDLPQVRQYPATVPGRVCHVDGDFLAYQCSYEKPEEPKEFDDMKHNVKTIVETLIKMAGASTALIHLTPKESDKGGRYKIALLSEYQANRKDRTNTPRFLHVLREWMHNELGAVLHYDKEADDGMSIAQQAAIDSGQRNLSIIATKDKDLNMVPGLHVNWSTGEIVDVDGFGWIDIEEKTSISPATGKHTTSKKLVGFGTAFFWAQVLMGDKVDNISGLPMVPPKVLNAIDPTQAILKAQEKLAKDPTHAPSLKVLADRTAKEIGPVMLMKLLGHVRDDKTAFEVCRALYKEYDEWAPKFMHWDRENGIRYVPWQDAFISEMKLLWMRRYNKQDDVLDWLGQVMA